MREDLTVELQNKLRGQGFLILKDGESFAVRVVLPAGIVTKEVSDKIGDIAQRYGKGYFSLTQRLDIEIPFVKYEDLEAVRDELLESGIIVGGTGRRVRSIHTCKGDVCRFGLINTEKLTRDFTEKFYKKYYDTVLPNKLRITVAGCKNSCPKPQISDIGIAGRKKDMVAIFIGGMNGSSQSTGTELEGIYTLEQAEKIVDNALHFFKDNGIAGERFPKMVARLGVEAVSKEILKNI
ncbi:MAG: hypothetical protein ACRCZ9_13225 [Fusobacteriaceae bacterium]